MPLPYSAAADAVGEELLKIGIAHEIILGAGSNNLTIREEKGKEPQMNAENISAPWP